jgi:hypothetical protein
VDGRQFFKSRGDDKTPPRDGKKVADYRYHPRGEQDISLEMLDYFWLRPAPIDRRGTR